MVKALASFKLELVMRRIMVPMAITQNLSTQRICRIILMESKKKRKSTVTQHIEIIHFNLICIYL